jgi:hypothetical protein
MTTYRRRAASVTFVLAGVLHTAPALAAQVPVTPYPAGFFAPAQPYSAFDMIARLPGFSFDGGDSEVRGFAGAGGNVLIDGKRPTSKQESLEAVLKRIPARSVERIELIRAGAAGVDMQGKALIANVVRVREATTRGRFEAGASLHRNGDTAPRLATELTRRSGDRLTELSASVGREIDDEKGQGPERRFSPTGALLRDATYRENKGAKVAEAAAGHERDLAGGRLRLDGSLRSERARADILEVASFPALSSEVVVERENISEHEVGGHFDRPLKDRWALETLALHHATRIRTGDEAVEGSDVTTTRVASDARETIARGLARRKGETTTLELGAEAALNVLDSHSGLSDNGVDIALPAANVRVEERRTEAFATLAWRATPALTIEGGMRLETSKLTQSGDSTLSKSFVYPKPRLLLTWAADERNQIRLEVERRVGQLDFADFVSSTSLTSNSITAGNPDLEPDRAWRLSATWERRFASDGALALTARYDAISDALDRVPVIGPSYAFDAPGNIGDGRRTVVQLDASLPLERLGVRGGLLKTTLTFNQSRVVDPTTGRGRRLSNEEPFEGAIHFTQDLPALRARWGVDAFLAEEEYEFRFDEVKHERQQTRYGVFAEFRPAPAWNLRLRADNLTSGKVSRRREQYAGPRGAAAVRRIETREMDHGPYAGVTLQRAFGG